MMLSISDVLHIFVWFPLIWGYRIQTPIFNTKYGEVYGSVGYARYGRPYYSFRGIPYAKPPIHNLRFKAPEPPDKWLGLYDATIDGPYCIQKNYLFANPSTIGQEDCLYLNVYTQIAGINGYRGQLLPVMVFMHWGGFFAGRGTSDYLSPEYFMEKDVVLVTFNYRLGVFGFLSTLDDEAPGNYALKDQRLALRWVQENIHNFCGDKSQVTIFGQSAGAGSVHYHMLSPLSKGLFQRAISQSGSALALWATPYNDLQTTILTAQAIFVNCQNYTDNSAKLISCLRDVPAEVLMESQDSFKTFFVDPLTVYSTVTETLTEANPEPFFTKLPIEYIQANEINHVPWIVGLVQDEGILKAANLLRQSQVRDELNKDFEAILSSLMYFSLSVPNTTNLYSNVSAFYLQNRNFVDISDPNSVQGLINLYTDRSFAYSTYQSAVLHSIKGDKPIWFYNFGYRGLYSYGDLFAGTLETINFDWGVSHCDDLLYLFNSPGLFPPLLTETDIHLSNTMVDMWTNFARHGDPNLSKNGIGCFDWKPLNIAESDTNKNDKLCFLNITGNYIDNVQVSTQCGFNKDRISFWAKQNILENIDGLV